jgi:hypothetical protein
MPDAVPAATMPQPLCARGRMLIRRGGALRLTACPLVDDDPAFDAVPDLEQALRSSIQPTHRRCTLCRGVGVAYVGTTPAAGL